MRDDFSLLVFHEKDTEALLKKIGLLEKVTAGEIRCIVCNKTITKSNFGAMFEKSHEIFLVCDELKCIKKLEEMRSATQ